MVGEWQRLNPEALIHVAYGGPAHLFGALSMAGRTFVTDPRLRTRDHPRERQSYQGLMRAVAQDLSGKGIAHILLVEFDVAPLKLNLMKYLEQRSWAEEADVMGVDLRRIDGTNHAHFLAHLSQPKFLEWLDFSIRDDKRVVLMMLGCITWWKWDAFVLTCGQEEKMPVYLELAMPTVAHHLGFRVRGLPEFSADVVVSGERHNEIAQRTTTGSWVLHPCKKIWNKVITPDQDNKSVVGKQAARLSTAWETLGNFLRNVWSQN